MQPTGGAKAHIPAKQESKQTADSGAAKTVDSGAGARPVPSHLRVKADAQLGAAPTVPLATRERQDLPYNWIERVEYGSGGGARPGATGPISMLKDVRFLASNARDMSLEYMNKEITTLCKTYSDVALPHILDALASEMDELGQHYETLCRTAKELRSAETKAS